MRVRLALLEPLPATKVLLPVPDSVKTINDLKKHILKSLSSVAGFAKKRRDLTLEINGFELLGGSGVGILQDGDVVSVKLAASSSKAIPPQGSKKRKARLSEPQASLPQEMKRKKLVNGGSRTVSAPVSRPIPSPSPSPSPSSSSYASSSVPSLYAPDEPKHITEFPEPQEALPRSARKAKVVNDGSSTGIPAPAPGCSFPVSESASSSSSSSSSDSSDSSSSEDSSDSDSDLEEGPIPHANGHQPLTKDRFHVLLNPQPLAQNHVPPGQGLARTKNRNARKRKALLMRKLAEDTKHTAAGQSSTLPAPTAPPAPSESPLPQSQSYDDENAFAQYSTPRDMANRNKKKGFLKEMAGKHSVKTVFESPGPSQVRAETATPNKWRHIPVVAPSQETNTPSNVFVTSKEYDWRRNAARSAKKWVNGGNHEQETEEEEEVVADAIVPAEETNRPIVLDEAMWVTAENTFDDLPPVTSVDGLVDGAVVAWKVGFSPPRAWGNADDQKLELDLASFSPHIALQLGTVMHQDGIYRLKQHMRPRAVDEEEEWNDTEAANFWEEDKADFTITNQDLLREPGKYRVFRASSSV